MKKTRLASIASFWAHGSLFGIWATMVPVIRDQLHLKPAVLGALLLCPVVSGVFGMWFFERFLRHDRVLILRVLGVLVYALLPFMALANTVWLLAVLLCFFGIGIGVTDQLINAQVIKIESRWQCTVMSGMHGAWSLGGLSGNLLGACLMFLLPFVVAEAVIGIMGAAVFYFSSLYMLPMPDAAPRAARTDQAATLPWVVKKGLFLLGVLMALDFAVEGIMLDWSAIFLRDYYSVAATWAGLGYAAYAGASVLGRFCGDRWRERWGDQKVLYLSAISGVFFCLAPFLSDVWMVVACFGVIGLTVCNGAPILFALAGQFGERAGKQFITQAIGWTAAMAYGGVAGAPPLFGLVAQYGSLRLSVVLAGVLCFFVAMGAYFIKLPEVVGK